MNKQIIFVMILSVLCWAPGAYAHSDEDAPEPQRKFPRQGEFEKNGQGPKGEGKHFEKLKELLNLTDEQAEALKAQKKEGPHAGKEAREQIHAKREALRAEFQNETLNLETIYRLNDEIKALNAEQMDARVERMIRMREILTAEQFQTMHENFQSKKKNRKGHYGQHGRQNRRSQTEE
ncbi:periplasmic heavy metal sensor [PVC group bacterium]|nr:periplasmic heavy metal sensor [PVC group bacterium]